VEGESPMDRKVVFLGITLLVSECSIVVGQQPATPTIFTSRQAEAGRTAYENSCGKCHTYTLLGRKGEDGELPPVASLLAPYQKFIGTPNHVPPLAGKVFLSRWGQKTAAELIARFQITASDPFFQFESVDDPRENHCVRSQDERRKAWNPALDQNDQCCH